MENRAKNIVFYEKNRCKNISELISAPGLLMLKRLCTTEISRGSVSRKGTSCAF
jgi:hypothetical protein